MEGEEAPETAAKHLAAARPPGTPRQPSPGGPGQRDASCHPPAARCAPAPPGLRPHPSSPPGRAQHLLPVQSQFSPSSRRSQDPAVPATPRGHPAPSPLASPSSDGLPGCAGRAGGTISACPSVAPRCPCPDQPGRPTAPAPAGQSRAGGAGPLPIPAGTSHPIPAPNPSGSHPGRGRELPTARPRQIAG